MIRVGIIGCGYWGPNLLRNFSMNPAFRVVAVAERKAEIRSKLSMAYPAVLMLEDAAELIARQDIDAVVIATPLMTHFPLARDALNSGKHVLVEKPLAGSTEEAEALIELARRKNLTLMVDHTFLFTGAVQRIEETVRSGKLGRVCYFDSMRANLGLFQPDVNCLWDLAPHDLSVINRLVDEDVVDIEASGYCHVNPRLPDMVYLTLHFASNTIAHLNLSWMSPVKIRRFTIGGTSQMLVWDDLNQDQKIQIYDSGIEFHAEDERATIIPDYRIGDVYSPRVSRQEALAGVVGHFADVIQAKATSIMSGEEGARIVRILEQAQKRLDASFDQLALRRPAAS